MALFTDGPISSIDDLAALDSQLLAVAETEGIDVTRKLTSAQEEVGVELTVLLNKLSRTDQFLQPTPRPGLSSVVVTAPMKLWNTYRTLEMIYRDAYNSQLNDRYAGKRDQFHEMAQWASERLIQTGVGVAANPVPRAGTPQVDAIPGALPDGTYYVSMAWINPTGEEGAGSSPAVFTITASALQVEAGTPPPGATRWNVYIGDAPESMVLQNGTPIEAGQNWHQAGAVATAGRAPGTGQEPTYLKPVPRVIQRG
ncbi:MAG: hypothetical protein LAP40_23095 [Acidobacteriia bacterium]|nr:hypothetical protein [Terriglobia bacterium]